MKIRFALLIGCLLPVLLTGCGGDDGDGGSGGGAGTDVSFLDIFNQEPNSTPRDYGIPGPLESDIRSLFGGPNDDPQEPEDVLGN